MRIVHPVLVRSLLGALLIQPLGPAIPELRAQTAAPVSRQIGTVQTVSATSLTLQPDGAGAPPVTITFDDSTRVLVLAPGSQDLKTAQPGTAADIGAGDRVLIATRPGDGTSLTATRVVLMKSSAIAQTNASREADWQRRGSGGIVNAVDADAGTLTITSGARKVTVTTTPQTIYRRYAPGSVRFEDATSSNLAAIQPGDQMRVRGDKATDGAAIAADEIVSGSFLNLAGTIVSVNAAAKSLVLKDLGSRKNVTVAVGSQSDLRTLPPETASRLAARSRQQQATETSATGTPATSRPAGAPADASASRSASGGDLSRIIEHLPKADLSTLKPGDALMIVASGQISSGPVTAVTVLTGVEPLLTASPRGADGFTMSAWNLGGGAGDSGAQ